MGIFRYHIDQIVSNLAAQKEIFHKMASQGPEGSLQTRCHKGKTYFVLSTPVDGLPGKYKRRGITNDETMLQSVSAAQYARSALDMIERNEATIRDFIDNYLEITPDVIMEGLPKPYRKIPVEYYPHKSFGYAKATDMTKLHEWASEPYKMSSYKPHERTKMTSRGLRVRSKSEALFCEKLYDYDLPFRYEQEIVIGKYRLAPDFTFLDRDGNEFYVEYCGMMDDMNYLDQYLWKRKVYEGYGICQWRNMIYVFENNNNIDMRFVDGLIRNQILPRIR